MTSWSRDVELRRLTPPYAISQPHGDTAHCPHVFFKHTILLLIIVSISSIFVIIVVTTLIRILTLVANSIIIFPIRDPALCIFRARKRTRSLEPQIAFSRQWLTREVLRASGSRAIRTAKRCCSLVLFEGAGNSRVLFQQFPPALGKSGSGVLMDLTRVWLVEVCGAPATRSLPDPGKQYW